MREFQQRFADQHRLIDRTKVLHARAQRVEIGRRQAGEICLHGPLKVEVVVDRLHGRFVRETVEEAQRADARFDAVRRQNMRRDFSSHLHLMF